MAPPLPPDEDYDDHPVARRLRLQGAIRVGFVMMTLILAGFLAAMWGG